MFLTNFRRFINDGLSEHNSIHKPKITNFQINVITIFPRAHQKTDATS